MGARDRHGTSEQTREGCTTRVTTPVRLAARRVVDIVVSGVALVLTFPILLMAAVAIKLDSAGPVVSRQARVGKDGTPFELLRLRSTVHETRGERPGTGEKEPVVTERSAKVTRVGRILRGASIDELPHLWNVLRGDMTLVGPRPEIPADAPSGSCDGDADRSRSVPGLTGTWGAVERSGSESAAGRQVGGVGSGDEREPDALSG